VVATERRTDQGVLPETGLSRAIVDDAVGDSTSRSRDRSAVRRIPGVGVERPPRGVSAAKTDAPDDKRFLLALAMIVFVILFLVWLGSEVGHQSSV
jgi:hypothetical protein